jgi:hypothetical protein
MPARVASQMVCFQTKSQGLAKFLRAIEGQMLVNLMNIWNILPQFVIIYGRLVYFVVICYIFPNLVCLHQEKSGNPDAGTNFKKFFF